MGMAWLLAGCSPSPAEDCRAGLDRLDQQALSVYGRLLKKVPERRPGGSADWALAMQKIRAARQADIASRQAECVAYLTQARILLKRAAGRY